MWRAGITATCHRVVGKIFVLQVIIPPSASSKGKKKKKLRINIHQLACEKPQTQPRTAPFGRRTNQEAAWAGGARLIQKGVFLFVFFNMRM